MPGVEVQPGLSVHVQDVGSGPPVVLLAGFGLNHEVWDNEVRVLSARHRVLCIDLRGTGRSDKPAGPYGMEDLAGDVEAVLDRLDLRDVTLVGWSFGGQVSFRIAATGNARVARLALVASNGVRASASEAFPFGPPAEKLEPVLVRAEEERRIPTRRRTVSSGFAAEPDGDLVDWLVRCQLQMPSWAAVPCYHTYLHTDQTADVDAVRLPVLQVIGDRDPVTSPDGARWLHERLADSRLVVIPECGHYPMFEAPGPFRDELVRFAAGG
jgi:pimeloyl-ACP methyl ester carboxylesterase